jgi:hypothetical protein
MKSVYILLEHNLCRCKVQIFQSVVWNYIERPSIEVFFFFEENFAD